MVGLGDEGDWSCWVWDEVMKGEGRYARTYELVAVVAASHMT